MRPPVGFEDPRIRQTFATGFGDIRDGLPYLGAIALQGLLVGALVGVAGTLTGLTAPWWALLLAPAGNLAVGLAAGLVLRYAGPAALRRFPNVPAVAIAAILSAVGALAAFFPLWWVASAFLIGPVLWEWTRDWAPLVAVSTTVIVLVLFSIYGLLSARLRVSFVELERRRNLERFLPAEAVERVLAGDDLALRGERRTLTVLFADLRDSTARAEQMAPDEVVDLLNRYVGVMAEAVFASGGMLDKFMGDGVMAIFGLMGDPSAGALPAARAALRIREEFERLNEDEPVPVRFGVGIHTGEVILGTLGIARRSDFTAIGDAVNTASRLEGLCKRFQVDCVLSGETASRLDGTLALRALGRADVRGRSGSLEVLTLA